MNSCEHYQELISRLVDADVSREEYEELLAHMNTCSRCSSLYAVFYDLSEIIGSEESLELPEGLHENIMAGVRRSDLVRKNRRTRSVWVRTALTAAACLALVLFAMRGASPAQVAENSIVRSGETVEMAPPAAAEEIFPASAAEEAAVLPAEETPQPAPTAVPKESTVPAPGETLETPQPADPYSGPAPVPTASAVTPSPAPAKSEGAAKADTAPAPGSPAPAAAASASQAPAVQTSASPAPEASASPAAAAQAPASPAPEVSESPVPAAKAPANPVPEASESPVPAAKAPASPVPEASESPVPAAKAPVNPAPDSSESPVQTPAATASIQRTPDALPSVDAPSSVKSVGSASGIQSIPAVPTVSADEADAPKVPANPPVPDAEVSAQSGASADAEVSPSPEPVESAAPSASPKPVKTEYARIAKEENRKKLQVLLSGTESPMPDETPDMIYKVTLISSDAYGSEEVLSIRIFGTEVRYYSTVDGESTSFASKCSPGELQTLLSALIEDERVSVSPSPSAASAPSSVPSVDPYLATPAPEAAAQK